MKKNLSLAIGAAALLASAAAHAAPLFSDDFDANALGMNATPVGWTVTNGTVDIIGAPSFFDLMPGNGRYIDLDGSSGLGGTMEVTLALIGGTQYQATFDLAGNHRGAGNDTVNALFGSSSSGWVIGQSAAFTTYALSFTPGASNNYTLSFTNLGGDNQGALLDRVQVSAVPEPSALALALTGVAMLALRTRRRRD